MTECACGCNITVSIGKIFVRGHNIRVSHPTKLECVRKKIADSKRGKKRDSATKIAISKGRMGKAIGNTNASKPAIERFLEKVSMIPTSQGCYLWTASTMHGHGSFNNNGIHSTAHRWAYERIFGKIPTGLMLHHGCNIRQCVNPFHLVPMTRGPHSSYHRYLEYLDSNGIYSKITNIRSKNE